MSFFSVFDGHGGDEVAQHCSDRLHQHFTRQLLNSLGITCSSQISIDESPFSTSFQAGSPINGRSIVESPFSSSANMSLVSEALRLSFKLTDDELMGTEAGEDMGATACIAIVSRRHIWVAHCGDSRAVIQRNGDSVALTMDHKPERPDELARIKALGGRVANKRVMGMLAMSRAIGDHYLRPYVIAEPEVNCVERTAEDEVLIIATDGLWDVFTCTEATNLARRCILRSKERGMSRQSSCRVSASVLAKAAIERGSRDNITVIVVDISPVPDRSRSLGDTSNETASMSPAAAVAEEEPDRQSDNSPPHSPSRASNDDRTSSSLPRRSSTKSLNKCVILKSSGGSGRSHRHKHSHSSSKDASLVVIKGLSPPESSIQEGHTNRGKDEEGLLAFSFEKMSNVQEVPEGESSEGEEEEEEEDASCSSSESESSTSVIAAKATISLTDTSLESKGTSPER
jgi:protein phosphatase 2C